MSKIFKVTYHSEPYAQKSFCVKAISRESIVRRIQEALGRDRGWFGFENEKGEMFVDALSPNNSAVEIKEVT